MSNDLDIHELAKLSPESILTLVGLRPRGPYEVESVEVKATQRRVDLLFTPKDPGDPRVYLEWQARWDATVERRLLEELVVHSAQTESFSPIVAVVVYTRPEWRAAALPADITNETGDVVRFSPIRVVLTEVDPGALLAVGGSALVALPLVGSTAQVTNGARSWLREVKRQASDEDRGRATDLFLRLLSWRLDIMDVTGLLDEAEELVEETATGRALLAKGEARGEAKGRAAECRRSIALVLETRLGPLPPWVAPRLEQERDLDRLEAILVAAVRVDRGANLEDLFTPRSD